MTKAHNPTPEERDERFSLYGLDPEQVGEAVLQSPRGQPEKPAGRSGKQRRENGKRQDDKRDAE